MSYYEKLNINRYLGHNIIVITHNGAFYEGLLSDGLINEDWQEDEEKEAIGLRIGNRLESVYLDAVQYIAKVTDGYCVKEAV